VGIAYNAPMDAIKLSTQHSKQHVIIMFVFTAVVKRREANVQHLVIVSCDDLKHDDMSS